MIALDWSPIASGAWQRMLGEGRSGLQQAWSYGEALRQNGVAVQRAAIRGPSGEELGCLQVADRPVLGPIGAGFLLRGPVWHDPIAGAAHYQAVLAGIRQRLARRMLVWAPEAPCHQARRPIISGYGTAWLDLGPGAEMVRQGLAPDWRRDLRRAEAGGLTVRQLATPQAIGWLLERNEAHRRKVGYRGPTRQFLEQLALAAHEARELVLLLAFERAEPVAGILVIRHGGSATYEVGHVAPRGRELRAGHLLLWHAITALIRKQARWLDLGGIATDRSPGIARFKLGMGGMVATLPGTFLMGGGMRA